MECMPFSEALGRIHDADVLLWRGRGAISRTISVLSRSPYTHAAMAAWYHGYVISIEIREFVGGRARPLLPQVRENPGMIDVFRADAGGYWEDQGKFDRRGAVVRMMDLAGRDYGYTALLVASLPYLPVVRWFTDAPADEDADNGHAPFCSDAISHAARVGGLVDPVPYVADRHTAPGDLARSHFYRYECTLVP